MAEMEMTVPLIETGMDAPQIEIKMTASRAILSLQAEMEILSPGDEMGIISPRAATEKTAWVEEMFMTHPGEMQIVAVLHGGLGMQTEPP